MSKPKEWDRKDNLVKKYLAFILNCDVLLRRRIELEMKFYSSLSRIINLLD